MTEVHFVRHGVHDLVHDRLCGRTPGILMGVAGEDQARRLGRHFAGRGVDAVHASPLERTRRTAEPIAEACGVVLEEAPALMEIDFGAWSGRRFAELVGDPAWHRWNAERDIARAPGGETMLEVQARLGRWLESIASAGLRRVVAVSHADVIKAAVALALGLSMRAHDRFEIAPASISTLRVDGSGLRLVGLNGDLP